MSIEKSDLLLILPPFTQMNTPYPSTAYLAGYLREQNYKVAQADLGLELLLKIFTRETITQITDEIRKRLKEFKKSDKFEAIQFFLESADDYAATIEPAIRFLQGRDPSLALRISKRQFLPEGPRFLPLYDHPELIDNFGPLATQDLAKYFTSLYIDDVADMIRETIDPHFHLSKYAESLAESQSSFDALYKKLQEPSSLIDLHLEALVKEKLAESQPAIVGLSCPFPGNVYGAFKIAQTVKRLAPKIKLILGGGFVNTELRTLSDKRVYEFFDALTFDDGERPLELFLKQVREDKGLRLRTMSPESGFTIATSSGEKDIPFKSHGGPDYRGLPLDKYFSMLEMPNTMHRMWSDFRWNKMILAHGCYWKKCTFCDISLDYISRFEPQKASQIVDQMESVIAQTGSSGFHFVDEAAPPALLRQMSEEILKRKLKVTWWGNIRFDTLFDEKLTTLMADAGCVAVTGGLEVASPRLLELINKGVSIEQVAKVTSSFKKSGIYVHAYLMYGFPSQTASETIDSLEVVRQLFAKGCLDSAYWHRFTTTAHSPVGKAPEKFGVTLAKTKTPASGLFAHNHIHFTDKVETDHDQLGIGLRKALYNYMHGIGLDADVREWFDIKVPKPKPYSLTIN